MPALILSAGAEQHGSCEIGYELQGNAMDGRKPTLRNLFIAALALTGQPVMLRGDDFIRQPALVRAQTTRDARATATGVASANPHTANATARTTQPARPTTFLASTSDSIQQPPQSSTPALGDARDELAAKISNELVAHAPATGQRASVTVASSLEPGPGWQSVSEELKEHVSNCERLLSHNAYLSAMEESRRGIIRLVRVLDLRQNKLTCEPAWARAQQALREALEFTTLERFANDTELVTRIIQSHETPALHGADVRELTPLAAAQHYRAYAEQCLVEASQGHPWFSELYYCMGRALEAQSASGDAQADALLQEALTYYRSARTIQPSNTNNTNQLAYVLLRMDRPGEALVQLVEVVRAPDCPLEAWQNLVEASGRVNDRRMEQWALQNYTALQQRGVTPASQSGTLVEVDPRQFAAMSPHTSGPAMQAQTASQTTAPTQSQAVAPTSAARTASTPRAGLFR